MRTPFVPTAIGIASFAMAGLAIAAPIRHADPALKAAINAPSRSTANIARDKYRHPAETLSFFRIAPTDTVVEIWPGGGWYTEILAPYLKGSGTLYEAAPSAKSLNAIIKMQQRAPATYGAIKLASFPASDAMPAVPDGSADLVLTFRNAHNWQAAGPKKAQAAFDQMFRMLKPGGYLGLVDHRLPETMDTALENISGYMKVSTIIGYARHAGFQVDDMSAVNANPKDTHDHAKGVWTLPPTFQLGDVDRAKYTAIGESDRMTIRFKKPR